MSLLESASGSGSAASAGLTQARCIFHWGSAMVQSTEAALLLEQARKLREVAPAVDQPIIKYDLLRLAKQSEELALTGLGPAHHDHLSAAKSLRDPRVNIIEEMMEPIHGSLQGLYAYWVAKRGSRIAPPRSSIWLEDMARLIPNIALIDVVGDPPRFRFHLCGRRLAEAYGENVTGKYLDEMDLGAISFQTLNLYTRIAREHRAQVVRGRFTKHLDGRYVVYERIGLPLSEDGKAVNMILCGYAYQEEPSTHRDRSQSLNP